MVTPVLSHDLKKVRKIFLKHLKPYRTRVYLFGSHATGNARIHSDIDIAILPLEPLPRKTISEIRDELEESDVLRNVDIVNLDEADSKFRKRVEKEGMLWKE